MHKAKTSFNKLRRLTSMITTTTTHKWFLNRIEGS